MARPKGIKHDLKVIVYVSNQDAEALQGIIDSHAFLSNKAHVCRIIIASWLHTNKGKYLSALNAAAMEIKKNARTE